MKEPDNKPSFLRVARSIIASAIGIQSEKNREEDFAQGSPMIYIIGGLVATIVFIVILYTIVSTVVGR